MPSCERISAIASAPVPPAEHAPGPRIAAHFAVTLGRALLVALFVAGCALLAHAYAADSARAQSAGDEQYADPFQQEPTTPSRSPGEKKASRSQRSTANTSRQTTTGSAAPSSGSQNTGLSAPARTIQRSQTSQSAASSSVSAQPEHRQRSRRASRKRKDRGVDSRRSQETRERRSRTTASPREASTGSELPVLPLILGGAGAMGLGYATFRGLRARRSL